MRDTLPVIPIPNITMYTQTPNSAQSITVMDIAIPRKKMEELEVKI